MILVGREDLSEALAPRFAFRAPRGLQGAPLLVAFAIREARLRKEHAAHLKRNADAPAEQHPEEPGVILVDEEKRGVHDDVDEQRPHEAIEKPCSFLGQLARFGLTSQLAGPRLDHVCGRGLERTAVDAHLGGHLDELIVREPLILHALLLESTLQNFGGLLRGVAGGAGRLRHEEAF